VGYYRAGSGFEVDWNGYPLGRFPCERIVASRVRGLATGNDFPAWPVCVLRSHCRQFVAPRIGVGYRVVGICRKASPSVRAPISKADAPQTLSEVSRVNA
jgi:hypothetical protein